MFCDLRAYISTAHKQGSQVNKYFAEGILLWYILVASPEQGSDKKTFGTARSHLPVSLVVVSPVVMEGRVRSRLIS